MKLSEQQRKEALELAKKIVEASAMLRSAPTPFQLELSRALIDVERNFQITKKRMEAAQDAFMEQVEQNEKLRAQVSDSRHYAQNLACQVENQKKLIDELMDKNIELIKSIGAHTLPQAIEKLSRVQALVKALEKITTHTCEDNPYSTFHPGRHPTSEARIAIDALEAWEAGE